MQRVRLIHWNANEAAARAETLRAAGYDVDWESLTPTALRQLRDCPPVAVVIDLGRLPSQGRDVALAIRKHKATRFVPLVFVDGDREEVARVQNSLPDAVYGTWSRIRTALRLAITNPPTDPVVPQSTMDGYSGAPLPKKLGIKAGSVVALSGAPDDFEATLGELPEGVTVRRRARGKCDLILWFTTSRRELQRRIKRMGAIAGEGRALDLLAEEGLGVASDLTQNIVREVGLAAGLVDYKVAAIDETWSGLRFTRRKAK